MSVPSVFFNRYKEVNQQAPQLNFILDVGLGEAMLTNQDQLETYFDSELEGDQLDYLIEVMHKTHRAYGITLDLAFFQRLQASGRYPWLVINENNLDETAGRLVQGQWRGQRAGAVDQLRDWYAYLTGTPELCSYGTLGREGSPELSELFESFSNPTQVLKEVYATGYNALFDKTGSKLTQGYRELLRGGKPVNFNKKEEFRALLKHVNNSVEAYGMQHGWDTHWPRFL